jgi:hypothetical protein
MVGKAVKQEAPRLVNSPHIPLQGTRQDGTELVAVHY